jgi:hypothetical protein
MTPMLLLLPFSILALVAEPGPVPGVPSPPAGTYEAELTGLAAEKAKAELAAQLDAALKDPSTSPAEKSEAKSRAAGVRLKLAIYTTPKSLEETVAFYGQKMKGASFLIAERNVLIDLAEVAQAGKFQVPASVEKEWKGKTGRTARWTREDQLLQISVEDYLIDPRDGKVSLKTVVLVTSIGF